MITFKDVTYSYPEASQPALRDVSLHMPAGVFTLLVGRSGAGKSTLLRCINGLVPHFSGGRLEGDITVDGRSPVEATPEVMSHHVGFVFQDPEAQFVMNRVEDEIAFALENAAVPPQAMRLRVEEVLDLLDLAALRSRRLDTLSGGERQRVAIASALALRPQVLVLDEPTSQLDPTSADDVLHALTRLNHDLGLTIMLVEHRLERVLPFVDTMVYLPADGAGVVSGPPRSILREADLDGPPIVEIGKAMGWEPLPLTIKEGIRFSSDTCTVDMRERVRPVPAPSAGRMPYLHADNVTFSYNGRPVLREVNLEVFPGEIVVLMGRNGAGKTTLLESFVGLIQPDSGQLHAAGLDVAKREVADICRYVGYLPQDPNALLFSETVDDELRTTLRNHGLLDGAADEYVPPAALLERLGVQQYAGTYPRDLSAGERQRVALGAVTVTKPGALLLDEPTRGLDYTAKAGLVALLHEWRDDGMAILLVTHDVEMAAAAADRVVLMSQGQIIARGRPAEILGASPRFAPQVAKLFPNTGWLTPEDVLAHYRN